MPSRWTYLRFCVWVLDDGCRPAIAALMERLGAGYMTRPDGRHAKTSNMNAALARRVAAEISLERPGPMVELGSGTWALTAMLAARAGQRRLVLVERDPAFCRRLATRFPEARVIEGDAADLPRLLSALPPAAAVVSGLSLYGLVPDLRTRIVSVAFEASAGDLFVQFSYAPRFPVRDP